MSQSPPPPGPIASAYPVTVGFQHDLTVSRWAIILNRILAIPHYLVIIVLAIGLLFAEIISFFTILFTKNIPDGLFNYMVMVNRYQWRVNSYVLFMRWEYPPFDFSTEPIDAGTDSATLSVIKPAEYNRWLPLVKWLLAIPHVIVLYVLYLAVFVVVIIAWFAVLFTGKWPEGMRNFVVGVFRWSIRVTAYTGFLVDDYPPFSLD
jgi:uncharacterized protein DUF4389